MGWLAEMIFLLILRYIVLTEGNPLNIPHNNEDFDKIGEESIISEYEAAKLEHLGRLLANILIQPWPRDVSPLLYIEEYPSKPNPTENIYYDDQISKVPYKRTRYYRKYPWKRQNSRYDAENRYLCQPTKEDVFRLLVALHEARQGDKGQMINFCNRKRPASVVFTNIRFLG